MGFYIETPLMYRKASYLATEYDAEILSRPYESFADVPEGKALVVVVDNNSFEAAAVIFDEHEYRRIVSHCPVKDTRFKTYVLMDKAKAFELSGYNPAVAAR